MKCPLCGAVGGSGITTSDVRQYFQCGHCALVYLHPQQRLSRSDERARYELHQNDPADPDYVDFLCRLADPVMEQLRPGAAGLDFGCGPSPALSGLLTKAGYPCAAYDPFFSPDESLLSRQYEYVTCCEVVEHLHDPAGTFTVLRELLAPCGLLGVMTRFCTSSEAFDDWWYRRDPTHVCFYNETTIRWIAQHHGLSVDFPRPDVALFTAPL